MRRVALIERTAHGKAKRHGREKLFWPYGVRGFKLKVPHHRSNVSVPIQCVARFFRPFFGDGLWGRGRLLCDGVWCHGAGRGGYRKARSRGQFEAFKRQTDFEARSKYAAPQSADECFNPSEILNVWWTLRANPMVWKKPTDGAVAVFWTYAESGAQCKKVR